MRLAALAKSSFENISCGFLSRDTCCSGCFSCHRRLSPGAGVAVVLFAANRVSGLPAEDGLAGGGDFVEAADAGGVRGGLDELGIFFGFFRDGAHGLNK